MMRYILFGIIWLLVTAVPGSAGQKDISLPVTVLFSGQDNLTHFRDEPWILKDFEIGANAKQTEFREADTIGVLRLEAESFFDWHPAPRKQFVLVISGRIEIKAGDGEKRIFEPGKILIAADDLGRGHQTKPLGDQPAVIVCVAIPYNGQDKDKAK
jgi:quercetin dioxygenase-like cupin family protein